MVAQHEVLGKARNRSRVPEGRLKLTNVIETRDQASLRDAKPLLTLTQHSVLGYLRIVPTGQFSPSSIKTHRSSLRKAASLRRSLMKRAVSARRLSASVERRIAEGWMLAINLMFGNGESST